MAQQTRREFLKRTAAVGGALGVAPMAVSGAQEAASAPAAGGPAAMTIARWAGAEPTPEDMKGLATKLTERAVAELGGMQRFVNAGDVVWIKPNMAWDRTPEQAANTNPDVVATLVRLCLDAGAKTVKVGDNTCNDPRKSYVTSGIEAAAKEAGAQVIYVDPSRCKDMAVDGEILKTWSLYPDIVESDVVINVPVVKHHSISTVTLCMKNLMGVANRDSKRSQWHQDLPTCLSDIAKRVNPKLNVLDAVRILTGNGPTGGNLADVKQLNTVAAGTDMIALDAFGAELLGHTPGAIPTIVAGNKAGLGTIDYRSLALKEVDVA